MFTEAVSHHRTDHRQIQEPHASPDALTRTTPVALFAAAPGSSCDGTHDLAVQVAALAHGAEQAWQAAAAGVDQLAGALRLGAVRPRRLEPGPAGTAQAALSAAQEAARPYARPSRWRTHWLRCTAPVVGAPPRTPARGWAPRTDCAPFRCPRCSWGGSPTRSPATRCVSWSNSRRAASSAARSTRCGGRAIRVGERVSGSRAATTVRDLFEFASPREGGAATAPRRWRRWPARSAAQRC